MRPEGPRASAAAFWQIPIREEDKKKQQLFVKTDNKAIMVSFNKATIVSFKRLEGGGGGERTMAPSHGG